MRFKRYLTNVTTRLYYHLKNLGQLFWVPLILIDVLLPLLIYFVYNKYGAGPELYRSTFEYVQWIVPLASVWWIVFILRDYIEGEGKELLYANHFRLKLADSVYPFIISFLNISILFLVLNSIMSDVIYEYIRIVTICILYFGIVYGLSFLTRSTTATLLVIILYTIVNIFYGRNSRDAFWIYFSLKSLTVADFTSHYLPLLFVGLAFIVMGIILNKKWII